MKRIIPVVAVVMLVTLLSTTVMASERPHRVIAELAPVAAAAVPAPVPVSVVSIIPAQAEPGGRVSLFGSGFGETASVFLGTAEIPVLISDGKQAEFNVPLQLEAGLYVLYLKRADGTVGRPYNFTVLPLKPVLSALTPDHISACSQGKEREVAAQGLNFASHALLLFDGAVIRTLAVYPDIISFTVPQVAGGLHQVSVKNSPDNGSVAMALTIETKPEVAQVTVGNQFVNYYELIVTGKNFSQNSSLFVDGQLIGGRGGQDMVDREKLIYIDCSKLIYQRHPYSPTAKDFSLQVINAGGESSQAVAVTAP
ncbi:MAG TPA: transcription factor [Desulfuromonadales bacterium]|nr:transcription factor [Desulfuromonadales bacterium]